MSFLNPNSAVIDLGASGFSNTAVGNYALLNNTFGRTNTALGNRSLLQNRSGANNTAVCSETLYLNNTGTAQVAVGDFALRSSNFGSTSTNANVAVGFYALRNNTIGACNTALGTRALELNTTGTGNTSIGLFSLDSNTTGVNNTAIGLNSGCLITTGGSNVVVGSYTVPNRATQSCNIFLSDGVGNLRMWITGSDGAAFFNNSVSASAFIGDGSQLTGIAGGGLTINNNVNNRLLTANGGTTSIDGEANLTFDGTILNVNSVCVSRGGGNVVTNTSIGNGSLESNTTGVNNAAIGYRALRLNTSGTRNIAIGNYALRFNTTGAYNVAIGNRTLYSNTGGIRNVAIGNSAMSYNTTGTCNFALGNVALFNNTVGSFNIALGNNALLTNTSGCRNVAVGNYSLTQNTTANLNTAVGNYALYDNTSGIQNTAIGRSSGCSITIGSSNVVIGSYTALGRRTESCNIFLSDGAANLRMWITGSNGDSFFNGAVSASAFIGDGSQLSGISAGGSNISSNVRGITIYDPTSAEDVTMYYTSGSLVINEVIGVLRGSASPSVTVTLRYGADRSAAGTVIVNAQSVTSTTTGDSLTISGGSVTVPDNNFIWLETTARAGTVNELFVQF